MSRAGDTAFQTPLKRARGLGAAHSGVGGFISERVSWMLLIPLSLWAVWAAISAAPLGYEGAVALLRSPLHATLGVLFVTAAFYHVRLVAKEAIEDYVSSHTLRLAALLANSALALLGGALGVVSILKVAFMAAV